MFTGVADKKNGHPNNAMVIHQLAANDDEDDQLKAEQVHIVDPPQDQLREPALDVLAPLTTED